MSRKAKAGERTVSDVTPLPALTTSRRHFGKHLEHILKLKRISQSELARLMWGEVEDKRRKIMVARNRDLISSYVNGRAFPSTETLELMADKLEMTVEELMPRTVAISQKTDNPISIIIPKEGQGSALIEWREEVQVEFAMLLTVLRTLYVRLGRVPTSAELSKLGRT